MKRFGVPQPPSLAGFQAQVPKAFLQARGQSHRGKWRHLYQRTLGFYMILLSENWDLTLFQLINKSENMILSLFSLI
jgi:hypothetical protein